MSVSTPDPALGDRTRALLDDTERIARYRWAAGVCPGRRVLDAGCGPDAETALLADAGAASLTAVVASDAAAELARPVLGDGIRCDVGTGTALPYADDAFDVVLAFGVLAAAADPSAILDELARVLAPGGVMLASLPILADRVAVGSHGGSQDPAALQTLVARRWPVVKAIEQRTVVASVAGEPAANATDLETAVGPMPDSPDTAPVCTLLVAGAAALTPPPALAFGPLAPVRFWLDDGERLAAALAAQTSKLDELRRRDERGADARRQLVDAEQRVARLAATEAERDDACRDLHAAKQRLRQVEEELSRSTGELTALRASRSWRLTAPLRWLQRQRHAG